MNILIINGSPKGPYSITLRTCQYLEILHPEHSFEYLNAAARIVSLEKDFSEAEAAIMRADIIVFAYPVYTFLAPSQLHRFIALMKNSGVAVGKAVTQITTSKHFYDVTAHNYVRDNCFDMEMRYIKGFSADMDDLTTEKGQKEVADFFRYVCWCMENSVFEPRTAPAAPARHIPVTLTQANGEKTGDVVIVADLAPDDVQLQSMISRFRAVCMKNTKLINIHDFPFKGGCLSCFRCAADGKCIYKDGFQELLRDNIQKSQAIVIAFSIHDHSMGTVFKTYDDRQFCNGHRTVTMGMPFGYLVSGNLNEEHNLRTVIEARAEVGGNFLAGIATDECDPDKEIDALARRLSYAVDSGYTQPANFYGVGGMKIFRDLIWLMQGLMKADHRFYKSHGQYDFPQKKRGTMLAMYLVGGLMGNEKLMAKAGSKVNEGMVAPYEKVLAKARKQVQNNNANE